jgi:hypothetical protein
VIPVKRYYGYLLALLVEVAAFYRHVLFQRGYLFPWDFRGVHLPLATFVAASIRRGEMPLWEPYTYCGNPIFANIQAALFYPPVLAATIASNWLGAAWLPRLLAIAVAAQVFFAGVCTFALLRRLGARPGAAFVSATVYQLGCFFAAQAEHMGAMHGGSWIPLVWLAVVELREGLRWFWMAVLSVALAMTIFAGLPQVAVAAFGSALVLSLLPIRALTESFRAATVRERYFYPIRVLFSCLWALLLAAIQIIPTAELTRHSVAKFRAEWLKTGGGIKLGALYTLIVPNYWGAFDMSKFHGPSDVTFLYLYCSLLGLALAVAAICWKPDRLSRAFALFALAATVWMLGDSTPVGRTIFLALPVSVRIGIHPEYTLPVFALGIAVLAGLGADRVLKPRWQVAAGAIIALDLLLVSSGRPFNTTSTTIEPGTTHDSLDGSTPLASRLRALTGANQPPYRYDMADAPYGWSSVGPILEIPTANGCDPMAPERVIQLRLAFAPGERWGACYQVVNAWPRECALCAVEIAAAAAARGGDRGVHRLRKRPRDAAVFLRAAGAGGGESCGRGARSTRCRFRPVADGHRGSGSRSRSAGGGRRAGGVVRGERNPAADPLGRRGLPGGGRRLVSRMGGRSRRPSVAPVHCGRGISRAARAGGRS